MNYVIIDGKSYDVLVTEIKEGFTVTYSENTGRTLFKGRMFLDPIGTFIRHSVTFARKGDNVQAFDDLWNFLIMPRSNGIWVDMADGQSTIRYEAYVSNGERALSIIDAKRGKTYWDALQINFIPMEAQVLPL